MGLIYTNWQTGFYSLLPSTRSTLAMISVCLMEKRNVFSNNALMKGVILRLKVHSYKTRAPLLPSVQEHELGCSPVPQDPSQRTPVFSSSKQQIRPELWDYLYNTYLLKHRHTLTLYYSLKGIQFSFQNQFWTCTLLKTKVSYWNR